MSGYRGKQSTKGGKLYSKDVQASNAKQPFGLT